MRPKYLPSVDALAAGKPHGIRLKYQSGCRCLLCRAANSRYESERARARAAGGWNGLVPAKAAKKHILRLSRQGVGRRALSAACDVPSSVIQLIRSGDRTQIRKRTEERILAVSRLAVSDAAVVPAAETWRQINALLQEGFTEPGLASRLGLKSHRLRFGKQRLLARTAVRVDRLYRLLMKE